MILCARSTSRSREQSTKHRSRSENMRKVCLFCSQNNKILWLSNMAVTFLDKFTKSARVGGPYFLDCAFRMLIGWAGELRSHGCVGYSLFWRGKSRAFMDDVTDAGATPDKVCFIVVRPQFVQSVLPRCLVLDFICLWVYWVNQTLARSVSVMENGQVFGFS